MKTTRTHILNRILFEANRVSDESHRKTILLRSCGLTTHKLFKELTALLKPGA